jgi:hypothetical protein
MGTCLTSSVALYAALQAPGTDGTPSSSASALQQHSSQQPGAGEDSISIDALYKLIGATKSERQSTLSSEQQAHVSKVQQQQLQQAAAAEAATIGTWLAPPHQQPNAGPEDGSGSTSSRRSAAPQQAVAVAVHPEAVAGAAAGANQAVCFAVQDDQPACQAAGCLAHDEQITTQRKLGKRADAPSVAAKLQGLCMDTQLHLEAPPAAQCQPVDGAKQRGSRASYNSADDDSTAVSGAGASGASSGAAAVLVRGDRQGPGSNGAMLRARHSAILHVAMMKAAAAAGSLAAGPPQHGQ